MAQRPKEHIRTAILEAASKELAEVGYERATLAAIARRAEISVGNVYKYFPSKEALFAATVPPELVADLRRLFRERVRALGAEHDATSLPEAHPYRAAAEELVTFSLGHRRELLFLLHHGEATEHASFREGLERELVSLAVAYAGRAYPSFVITPPRRRALRRVYRAFVDSLAGILDEEKTDVGAREATAHLATYHLAGLRAFFQGGSA